MNQVNVLSQTAVDPSETLKDFKQIAAAGKKAVVKY